MSYEFRWNEWNIEHIAEHGVTPDEAEWIVNRARAPYPRRAGGERYLAVGQTSGGDYLQVVYILDPADTVFVIHARPLTDREKKALRRRRRK